MPGQVHGHVPDQIPDQTPDQNTWYVVQLSQNLTKISLVLITFPPQVRIFGVTVLVAAWWLDAAAKGIPPTIPFVNFNTVT